MKLKIARLFFRFLFLTGLYRFKTRVQRFLLESKRKQLPVKAVGTWKELVHDTMNMAWQKDGFLELWDKIDSPETAEWKIKNAGPHAFDCDEFSITHLARIKKNGFKTYNGHTLVDACLLMVVWADDKNVLMAHHVCMLTLEDTTGMKSYTWLDYWPSFNNPVFRSSPVALASAVAQKYTPSPKKVFAVTEDLDLKILKVL